MTDRYLLDTNVVSELRKARPHGGVVAWLQSLDDTQIYLSAVTIGEIQAGIELTREQDPGKAAEIEAWLEQVAVAYNVLPMEAATFRTWARLMHRKSDTLYEDAMIAATAQIHGLIVATRNVADFDALGMGVFNPFATGVRTPDR
ncbi:type II toxin-antitoxin system VapC family toxin [Tibeticola sp.]|uniref:type II toxin-antitoxin system VapC family toxin n=1 Tax=Tibeticola sp. TaxID=2005368 RepID=UPI0025FFA588|nr:type II toxin-antitoxin system VapC family toxin [Tibeticola sp.]